ncbi:MULTISPECIES: cytochrome P450 [Micromonospora]|uniref:cytochrome P450 n=1 Tax=Micromonospora TaxID=1873 RepID=UPI0013153502|nr:cytochrome P450 [Verrucosispora sp. FIM060022]
MRSTDTTDTTDTTDLPAFPMPSPFPGEPPIAFAQLREEKPVARVRLPTGDEAWLVTGHAENRIVLTDARFSRAAAAAPGAPRLQPIPPDPGSMLNMDPPEHTRLRRLVAPAFTPRRIEDLRPALRRDVDALLDDLLAAGPPADLVTGFARRLPVAVICELLGVPGSDRRRITEWVDLLLSLTTHPPQRIAAARREMKAYLAGLVESARDRPGNGLLSQVIEAYDEIGGTDDEEVVMLAATILTGGFLTTAGEIALSIVTLLRHPEQLAALRREPETLPRAVEELLRYNVLTTGGGLLRVATEDVVLGGVRIRAGEAVLPAISAANRDPRVYTEPDVLDFRRPDNPHITFGLGVHYCLGAKLARIELEEALAGVLRRLPPTLRLAGDMTALAVHPGHLVRGLPELPITW